METYHGLKIIERHHGSTCSVRRQCHHAKLAHGQVNSFDYGKRTRYKRSRPKLPFLHEMSRDNIISNEMTCTALPCELTPLIRQQNHIGWKQI